jgi:hypothetical protein
LLFFSILESTRCCILARCFSLAITARMNTVSNADFFTHWILFPGALTLHQPGTGNQTVIIVAGLDRIAGIHAAEDTPRVIRFCTLL